MTDAGPIVTKSGRVLTDADIEAVAAEAEAGYEHLIHKAEPGFAGLYRTCREPVHRVPGGQGPTWVHTASGAVAAVGKPGEPDGWMIEHARAFSSPTCRFGPFATLEDAKAWAAEHPDVSGQFLPLYLDVDWGR